MFPAIKAAIVDLDGTMLDTAPDFLAALNRMRTEFDLAPLALDTIQKLIGKGTEHLIQSVLRIGLEAEQAERAYDSALTSYLEHYLALNGDHATLYPDVVAGLEALAARGLRLACVTNKPIALTFPLLRKKGLDAYFEIVYGGDSFAVKKPDPYPLLQVCRGFGLQPPQVLAIGDSSNDVQAARAAGCKVLTVPYGYNHGQPIQEADSDGIVATLLHAANLLSP